MKITDEILKWLMENAYAEIGGEYWYIVDSPPDKTPDHLIIPITFPDWEKIKGSN